MGVVIFSSRTAKRLLSLLHERDGHGIETSANDRHDFPYRARLIKSFTIRRGDMPLKVMVTGGKWIRRDQAIEFSETELTIEETSYIYVFLTTAKEENSEHPSLVFDTVGVEASTTWPEKASDNKTSQGNRIRVIGRVTVEGESISRIEQYHAGDIVDWVEVPDSHNEVYPDNEGDSEDRIKTLEWHDIETQKKLLGLYGVDTVEADKKAIGIYHATTSTSGELRWYYPDSEGPTDHADRSIELDEESEKRFVQLWKFRNGETSEIYLDDHVLFRHKDESDNTYELQYVTLASLKEKLLDEELTDYADGTTIRSRSGQLVIGQRRWNIGELSLSGSGVSEGAVRWAYVEINLDTGDAELKLSADGNKPTDTQSSSGYLYCITLSRWKRTADGWERLCRARPELHIHGILAE